MTSGATLSLRAWTAGAARLPVRLGRWWLGELRALVPERALEWLGGRRQRRLVVAAEGGDVVLLLFGRGADPLAVTRTPRESWSPDAVGARLASSGLTRGEVELALRLPAEKFFPRRLVLPRAAAADLDRVLALDLARRTPLRLDDVHHDHLLADAEPGKILVRHWVIRRAFVDEALAELGLDGVDVVDGEATGADEPAPRIRLRRAGAAAASWRRRAGFALVAATVLLALAAGASHWVRQQDALDDLETRIAAARPRAQQVRAALNRMEQAQAAVLRLRSRKADDPGLLDLWQEATRVLPAHTWLTELRLTESDRQGRQLAMTGVSGAAASLVGLLGRSALLAEPALTAPVTLDPIEGGERFALQAAIRRAGPIRSASR
jgi:general secretion pathway protein L